jgi:RNA polymerase sigma-70 factor, ECF subfamily
MITFDTIWETYQTDLRRFIENRIGDAFTTDDILQDVLLKAFQSLDTLADPNRLQAWLYRIARNAIIDHYRRERQIVELSETIPMPEPDELTPLETLAKCVPSMIDDLNGPYREALQLAGLQGIQQQTIAEQLGISVSGAKSRVQRGRSQLKELLLKCCWFEFDRRGGLTDYGARQCCCTN